VLLTEQSLVKKTLKTASKSGNKRQRNVCTNYAPLEGTVLQTRERDKKTKTTFSHLQHCAIFPKLCTVIDRPCRDHQKGVIHFWSNA